MGAGLRLPCWWSCGFGWAGYRALQPLSAGLKMTLAFSVDGPFHPLVRIALVCHGSCSRPAGHLCLIFLADSPCWFFCCLSFCWSGWIAGRYCGSRNSGCAACSVLPTPRLWQMSSCGASLVFASASEMSHLEPLLRLHNPLRCSERFDLEWPLIGMTRHSEFATTSDQPPQRLSWQRTD